MSELAVKQVKILMRKCDLTGQCYSAALAKWRATQRADGFSPAMLFSKRDV
jgi:hypothetical protein